MTETFFIADTHFGHKKILEYCKEDRVFNSIEEHDQELINRWNSKVTDKDEVWMLGDFCLDRRRMPLIASQLKGKKFLVMGNHDLFPTEEYLAYFSKLYGAANMKGILLTHIPVHEYQLSTRFRYNIHGHMHSNRVMRKDNRHAPDLRYVNVSVEQINLTPISLDELKLDLTK